MYCVHTATQSCERLWESIHTFPVILCIIVLPTYVIQYYIKYKSLNISVIMPPIFIKFVLEVKETDLNHLIMTSLMCNFFNVEPIKYILLIFLKYRFLHKISNILENTPPIFIKFILEAKEAQLKYLITRPLMCNFFRFHPHKWFYWFFWIIDFSEFLKKYTGDFLNLNIFVNQNPLGIISTRNFECAISEG